MLRSRLNVVGLISFELFAKINPILKSWIFTFNAKQLYQHLTYLTRGQSQIFKIYCYIIDCTDSRPFDEFKDPVYFGKNYKWGALYPSQDTSSAFPVSHWFWRAAILVLYFFYMVTYTTNTCILTKRKIKIKKVKWHRLTHKARLLGHCHTFGREIASKMSIYLSLGVKHKILSVIITTPSANLNPIMECKQGAPFSKRDKIQVLQRNIFPK